MVGSLLIATRFSALSCTVLLLAMPPAVARADAGAVCASQRHGNRQVTVFSSPTPLAAGPIDISVFIQDADTGEPVLDDAIEIEVAPRDGSLAPARYEATPDAATNKLFQAAEFELPDAGAWQFTIVIHTPDDDLRVHFELEAADSLPTWRSLWPWFCWPFLVIAMVARFHATGTRNKLPTASR
ncbi:MAG TPA: hypothetical protein VNH11_07700 [Pirellulales bacterium]|nr:hypothetical protein [Pirellulales bacterium]